MKVCILSTTESNGGAARAANRLHHSLLNIEVNSKMRVQQKQSTDWHVKAHKKLYSKMKAFFGSKVEVVCGILQKSTNPVLHSTGLISSLNVEEINQSDVDVVNLHWVLDGFLSVKSISRIKKPIVWTLHDSWVFCGSEHYPNGNSDFRYVHGYQSQNKPIDNGGFDLDKWTWKRKLKHWKRPFQIVTPSTWLGVAAKKSAIGREWSVTVIPNAVATNTFKPIEKKIAREIFSLPIDKKIILFGGLSYLSDKRKGHDLLRESLNKFISEVKTPDEYLGVVLGHSKPKNPEEIGLPLQYAGFLHDDQSLSLLYNAADVVIVPSRMENLPQIATEALSCGTPVVAFNTCGIPDAVIHKQSGYLAKPYDTDDLSYGIKWVLEDETRHQKLSKFARDRAVELWSQDVVANQYVELFKQVIRDH